MAVTVMSGAGAPSACITLTENTEIEERGRAMKGKGERGRG